MGAHILMNLAESSSNPADFFIFNFVISFAISFGFVSCKYMLCSELSPINFMNELLSRFLNLLANLGAMFTKKSLMVFAICYGPLIVVLFILRLLMVVCFFLLMIFPRVFHRPIQLLLCCFIRFW